MDITVNGEEVTVTVNKPAKMAFFSVVDGGAEDGGVQWSDNAIDLFPGDPQVLQAKGLAGRDVTVSRLR